jgi:hypothetical protein
MMQQMRFAGLAVLGMAVALMAGCQIDTHKDGDGKDVKISTPFGGMQVKTNDTSVLQDIGLPAYPGAVPVKEDNDNGSADVNMSFGDFKLRVKAAGYRTSDSPEQVEAFYRNGLKRFGQVIACRNNHAIGSPSSTPEGLDCDNTQGNHISVNDHAKPGKLELKAGSKVHQHIVSIDPDGTGTKFGLVALDLPGKMFSDSGDDEQKQ